MITELEHIDIILGKCSNPHIISRCADGDLSYFELRIADNIRDLEISKEAAYENYENARSEFENRLAICRNRASAILPLIFSGFNRSSFQTIEMLFPGTDHLTEVSWKNKWSEKEKSVLAEARKVISQSGDSGEAILGALINRERLKQAAIFAAEIDSNLFTIREKVSSLKNDLVEFEDEEVNILSELAESKYGTKEYSARFWNKSYWRDRQKARKIGARLEDKKVADLLEWWTSVNEELALREKEVKELSAEAARLNNVAPFGKKLSDIGSELIPEIETLLVDSLIKLTELPQSLCSREYNITAQGSTQHKLDGGRMEMLATELSRLLHQNSRASEGEREKEKQASILRAAQDKLYNLHNALNSIRKEESERHQPALASSLSVI